jgi:hypothetical protein
MRTAAVASVLGAALVLAAAAPAAFDPKEPQQRHTAADTRLAKSLALKQSDLASGWRVDRSKDTSPPCSVEPDESNLVQTARIDPTFTWRDGLTNLGSEVDIFRTSAQARTDWRLSTLALMKACVLEAARSGVGKGVQVTIVSAERLPAPHVAERNLHYRIVFAVHGKQTVPIVVDLVALGRGRTTVVLHALTVDRPLPAAVEKTLVGILGARLTAGRGVV